MLIDLHIVLIPNLFPLLLHRLLFLPSALIEVAQLGEDNVAGFARDKHDQILLQLLNLLNRQQFVRHCRRNGHQTIKSFLCDHLIALTGGIVGKDAHNEAGVDGEDVALADTHERRQSWCELF